MNNKKIVIFAACALGLLGAGWFLGQMERAPVVHEKRNLTDEALLALLKNDQAGFESVVEAGVDMHAHLPEIDGKKYTVAEGLAYFERVNFISYLQERMMPFIQQEKGQEHDVLSLSIPKNNLDLLELLVKEKPKLDLTYGANNWSLLHMASALCSHRLTQILHEQGKLNWDLRAKDGSTPLTLAAENECLPMLGYWKDQKADFKKKDGRGLTALGILKKKKSAALVAFVEALVPRKPAAVVRELDFYRKRKIPKHKLADHSAIVEPEIRPLESIETADISEFSD